MIFSSAYEIIIVGETDRVKARYYCYLITSFKNVSVKKWTIYKN